MTLIEFLQDKTLSAVETVDGHNLIVNIYVDETCYGLNVNMTNIVAGTMLTKREDFTIEGDILSIDNITLDITKTEMLG
jgi:hypothetical protein